MEFRCRWCDHPLPAGDLECADCLERELRRRVGQRGDPAALRGLLDDVLALVDVAEDRALVEAFDAAVRERRGLFAARQRLQERLEAAPAGEAPGSEAGNLACARTEALRAVLFYPYDYEASLRQAARAAARRFAWIAAKAVVPRGPAPPGPAPGEADAAEPPLWEWAERRAWEGAWHAAYQEALAAAEGRLYRRFLTDLRRRIGSDVPGRTADA